MSRLLDFLGEEGWPVGVGQSPDNPTELSEAGQCEGEGERLKYLVRRPTTLVNSKHKERYFIFKLFVA